MEKTKTIKRCGGKFTRLQNQTPPKYRDDSLRRQHHDNSKGTCLVNSFMHIPTKVVCIMDMEENIHKDDVVSIALCISEIDLHTIGIAETHLPCMINDNDICMNNNIWRGNK